ncbi:MAG: glycosyltransferase family 1 protein [Candidatus Pacebacteria bacterium]|nr:glycosyltransferase family 1 protein [Candidatus Paceibacterota bacterium]
MKKNKNIVIGINASFIRKPNNGIGQVTANFLKTLARITNHESRIILYLEEDLPRDFKLPKNFEKRIFLPPWKRDDLIRKIWWEKYSLPKKIKKDKCDVFLSLYQCPTILEGDTKHIMLVHDIVPKLFPEYLDNSRKKHYWQLTEYAIARTDKVLTVSRHTEKDLINYLNIPAGKITPNYIDVDEIYKKSVSQKESARVLKKYKLKPGYILAGGGMEIRKNVEGVFHAYKFMLERGLAEDLPPLVVFGKILPNLSLAFDAENFLKVLNMTKKVRLLDMVPQKDMPALYKNSSFFVYPSYYEGFGMPPLEAMNQGKSVIVSKNSSLPEVGGDGVLYCQADDIYDIAMVMKNVLSNPQLREDLSRRAKLQAEKFSWERFVKKVLNIVNEI